MEKYGVSFTRLIAMANMPIGRFLKSLVESGNLNSYMKDLEKTFNHTTAPNLMCRTTISVGWDGQIYDCDFNQALGLEIRNGASIHIENASVDQLVGRTIKCHSHCYGCTAGQGSSCAGIIA